MRRGLTLIEILAVTVILALLAVLGLPALVRAAGGDPLAATIDRCVREATMLRASAIGVGLELQLDPAGWTVRNGGGSDLRLDDRIDLRWSTSAGDPLAALAIDRRGRSADVRLEIRRGALSHLFAIDGLSGEWRRLP